MKFKSLKFFPNGILSILVMLISVGTLHSAEIRVLNWQGYGTDEKWAVETFTKKNFKSAKGYFEIIDNKNSTSQNLTPEIRVYNKPETITYEASINTRLFSDSYLTMSNISNTDVFNIKFQKKPFMNFIWFSVLLISLGGILQFARFRKKI